MRTPFFVAAFSGLAIVMAGCSQPEARADEDLRRDLDLALNGGGRAVVSNLEIAGAQKTPARAPATVAKEHTAHAHTARPRPAVEERVAVAARAQPDAGAATVPAAGAPAEETAVVTSDPAPQVGGPAVEPEPAPAGRGRIGVNFPMPTDIGISRPGTGGVIVIRGGPGGNQDPCDERDRTGRRIPVIGGGVLINPTFPTAPGSGTHTGRGGRGGGVFR